MHKNGKMLLDGRNEGNTEGFGSLMCTLGDALVTLDKCREEREEGGLLW